MPARANKIRHDENTRLKIKTSQIINRLMAHIRGEIELSTTQVSAAKCLLDKTLANLSQVDHSGEVETRFVIEAPSTVDTTVEWQKQITVPSKMVQ